MVKLKENQIIKNSFLDLIKNPLIVIPSMLLIIFSIILSQISSRISIYITDRAPSVLAIWLVLFTIVFFFGFSYFYSGLIQASFISLKKKVTLKEIFKGSNKFWVKNFFAIIIIVLFYSLINGLVGVIAYFTGKSLGFSVQTASFFFYFLYFLGLIGFIVFLTYTSFFLVRNNLSIYKSLKESIYFTARNYIFTIITIFSFFILTELLSLLNNYLSWNVIGISDIIAYLILYPLLSLILARAIEDLK